MQGEKEAQNIADVRSPHFKLHAKNRLKIIRRTRIESWLATENHTATCVTLRCNLYHFTTQYDADCTLIPVTSQRNMTQIAK